MNKRNLSICLIVIIVISMLMMQVAADTSFTFTAPGSSADTAVQPDPADQIKSMIDTIQQYYYKDVKVDDLIDGAMKGMFSVLDPHSEYFTKEEYKVFSEQLNGEIVGIGVQIENKNGIITVVTPIEDSPAFKAGIKAGDQIVSVDGKNILGYTSENASAIIRGQEGTKVKIGIRRENVKDIIYFDLTRAVIKTNPVKYEIKSNNIGYLRLTQFDEYTADSTQKALDYFKSKNVKGIIIDVRNNPGGLLDQVTEICKMIIPKGPIYHIKTKSDTETVYSELEKAPFKIVVLVNGGSASASEILSGAVKDSKVGILVGEKTYGKGTVQNVLGSEGSDGFKITIANYLTPSGFSLDGIGLKPDVEVKYDLAEELSSFAPLKGDKSLKYNTVSLEVLAMQQRLKKLGYSISDNDGFFSTTTKAAVLKFQKANKLKQDAVMDLTDLKVLVKCFEEKMSKNDPQLDRALVEIQKLLKK